jgi:hypothetical protein
MGVSDDTDSTSTSISTRDQILNLRRSVETAVYRNCNLTWSPIDKEKWYYINAESTNSDLRMTVPATLVYNINATITFAPGFIDVQYVIEFEGATVVAI